MEFGDTVPGCVPSWRSLRWLGLWLSLSLLAACGPQAGTRKALLEKWPNGQTRCSGELVLHEGQWVKDGPVAFFNDDGKPRASGNYRLGLEQGAWTEFLQAGMRGEGAYVDGKRHGPWVYTYADGKEQERGLYEYGARSGEWRSYYPEGKIQSRATYQSGKLNGPRADFRIDGSLIAESSGIYKDGAKIAD